MLAVRFSKVEYDLREPYKPAKRRRMRIQTLKSDIRINTDCKKHQLFWGDFRVKNLQYIFQ